MRPRACGRGDPKRSSSFHRSSVHMTGREPSSQRGGTDDRTTQDPFPAGDGLDGGARALGGARERLRLLRRGQHLVDERRVGVGVQPGARSRRLFPLDRSSELRLGDRQPLLAVEARHGLPLQGRARNDPPVRRRDRDPSNQADPRHPEHRRPGYGLPARKPGRADLRLLRPGQAGQRLVHGRTVTGEAARPHGGGKRLVAVGRQGGPARNHHAGQPAAGRQVPPGVLPARPGPGRGARRLRPTGT